MARHLSLVLPFLALAACGGKDTGTTPTGTTTGTPTGTTTTGTSTGTTSGTAPAPVSLEVTADASSYTTRDRVMLTATATMTDGSTRDVSLEAAWTSSDEEVVRFYEPAVGQPVGAGTVELTASVEGVSGSVTVTVTLAAVQPGDIVINELLIDGLSEGDPNGDGVVDAVEDEFVEIANTGDVTVDLSGVTLVERDFYYLPRHTFAEGTVLRAGEAIVVFGGGSVDGLAADHVAFLVADNDDPGTPNGVSLGDAGDHVWLLAPDGTVLDEVAYGSESLDGSVPTVQDGSLNRDPDVWGTDWSPHADLAGAAGAYSAGLHADGTPFEGPDGRYGP